MPADHRFRPLDRPAPIINGTFWSRDLARGLVNARGVGFGVQGRPTEHPPRVLLDE